MPWYTLTTLIRSTLAIHTWVMLCNTMRIRPIINRAWWLLPLDAFAKSHIRQWTNVQTGAAASGGRWSCSRAMTAAAWPACAALLSGCPSPRASALANSQRVSNAETAPLVSKVDLSAQAPDMADRRASKSLATQLRRASKRIGLQMPHHWSLMRLV